mmetsp:Transcript_52379/g.114184  ORF Transcript_52379/g.114184 Transcript_52379/m.114184 type:complete len:220 (-) Transcript_52379:594-1253(-)
MGGINGRQKCRLITIAILAVFTAIFFGLYAYFNNRAATFGNIHVWYELPTCRSTALTSTTYNVFPLNRAEITGLPEDCSLVSNETRSVRISLEQGDGFQSPADYTTSLVLKSGHYATLAMSIEDAEGNVLTPITLVEAGPDYNYPWRAVDFSDPTSTTASTPRSPPPSQPPSPPPPSRRGCTADGDAGRQCTRRVPQAGGATHASIATLPCSDACFMTT